MNEQVLVRKFFIYRITTRPYLEDIIDNSMQNSYPNEIRHEISITKTINSMNNLVPVEGFEIGTGYNDHASFFSEKELIEHFEYSGFYLSEYTYLPHLVYVDKKEIRSKKINAILD